MSEFAKPSPASTNFMAFGIFEGSGTPSTVVSVLLTFGSSGLFEPRSNVCGFLSSVRCLIPIAVSPASYTPGESFARGSFTFDPVMPSGRGGAGCGANGFAGAAGVGDGEGVCASAPAARHELKKNEATTKRKATVRTRFIVPPLRFFTQHSLHNSDFGALAAIDISREIEQLSILPGARSVEQILDHRERAAVMLNHTGQE